MIHHNARGADRSEDTRGKRGGALLALIAVMIAVVLASLAIPAGAAEPICVAVADFGGKDHQTINGTREDEDLLTIVDLSDHDPDTNETNVGDGTDSFRVEAIAFEPGTGVLFAVDRDRLGTLSLDTGKFSARGALGGASGKGGLPDVEFDDVKGLTFGRSGTLWASHRRGNGQLDLLIEVDPATGATAGSYVPIQAVHGLTDIEDLAGDLASGRLYAIANQGGRNDRLVWIDPATGDTTDVGAVGVNDMEGLAFTPGGALIGVSKRVPGVTEGGVWDIDKATGAASNPREMNNGSNKESIACQRPGAQSSPSPSPTETPGPTPTPTTTVGPNITRRGSITVVKNAVPDSPADFLFSGDLGTFSLDDDDDATLPRSRVFDRLRPGRYVVSEELPTTAWEVTAIACVDPDDGTTVSLVDARATIDLDGRENIVCTFTNVQETRVRESIRRLPASGTEVATAMGPLGLGTMAIGTGLRSVAAHRARQSRGGRRPVRPGSARATAGMLHARPIHARRARDRYSARPMSRSSYAVIPRGRQGARPIRHGRFA